jgi:hypothetical protein
MGVSTIWPSSRRSTRLGSGASFARERCVRANDWRGLLSRQIAQSRQILKKLLVGRIVFRQRPDGSYEFSGQASLGRILASVVGTKAGVAPT